VSDDLEKRLREMHRCDRGRCSETFPCDNLIALHEAAEVAVEIERERIAANLDRFIGMGDKHGKVSCIALVRSAQRDIRDRTEGNNP
jgi:hypothetical protein